MKHLGWILLVMAFLAPATGRAHIIPRPHKLERVNRQLHGQLIDHTRNHGPDRRIWSPALQQWRDLYVYLPPGFSPEKRYPLLFFLHGFQQDELLFIDQVVRPLDQAIARGELPPVIIAAPDGSLRGFTCILNAGSFFLNSLAGRYEDYLMDEVYPFVLQNYPVRPEPEAHAFLGVSMGGGAAYTQAIRHPDKFRIVVGIFPPLNLRWMSCRGRYLDNFDPDCWGWRDDFNRGHEVVGRFFGVITIRLRRVFFPLYGRDNPDSINLISRENPIEMLDTYDVKPGQFQFYIAYGGKDEFNIDAQVESFLYRARQKGIPVDVGYDPNGHHDEKTAFKLLPGVLQWLKPRLDPYAPQ